MPSILTGDAQEITTNYKHAHQLRTQIVKQELSEDNAARDWRFKTEHMCINVRHKTEDECIKK